MESDLKSVPSSPERSPRRSPTRQSPTKAHPEIMMEVDQLSPTKVQSGSSTEIEPKAELAAESSSAKTSTGIKSPVKSGARAVSPIRPDMSSKPTSPKKPSPTKSDPDRDIFEYLQFPPRAVTPSPRKVNVQKETKPKKDDSPDVILPSVQEAALEQAAHLLENQLVQLSQDLEKEKLEKRAQMETNDLQKSEIASLKNMITAARSEIADLKNRQITDTSKNTAFDQEKQILSNILLSKQQEIVRLSEELNFATKQLSDLKQESRKDKETLSVLQADELHSRTLIGSLQQEIDQSKKTNEWLNKEISLKTDQFGEYRREKSNQVSQLQNDLENMNQEHSGLLTRFDMLQKQYNEVEAKLSEKLDKIRDLENSKIVDEQRFKNEMLTQKKLTDLYLSKSQETAQRNENLEELIRELEAKVVELGESGENGKVQAQTQIDALKEKNQAQEVEIERLKSELHVLNADFANQNISSQVSLLSETAAAASRLQKSGKSITEVYSDYSKLQQELIKEKSEVSRLTECVNLIVAEFEQRAPIIQKTNEEYQKSRERVEQLSSELAAAIREKNQAVSGQKQLLSEIEKKELENRLLERDIKDRSKQVQALLREQYLMNGAHQSEIQDEMESETDENAAESIISKRLVVFKNIEELQAQNEALLRSIRSLSAKMEAQEQKDIAELEESRLEELNQSSALIEQLQDQLKREVLNSETFARERDMWRRIAEGRDQSATPAVATTQNGPDFETYYKDLQREFDVYRRECGTDTKLLKNQLEEKQHENTDLLVQVAKLNNHIAYLNERHAVSVKGVENKDRELDQLRGRMSQLNTTAARQDAKIEELSNTLAHVRQELQTVLAENQRLKIDAQILKSTESRHLKESQDFLRERNTANDRIRELQNHITEQDLRAVSQLKKLQTQVDSMSQDLQLSRKQISDLMDDNRTLSAKRDAEFRESQIKIEKLTIEYEKTKGALALASNKEATALSNVKVLTEKISTLEKGSLHFEPRAPTAPSTAVSILESETESSLKIELQAAKAELILAREQVDTFKAISQASEERLTEMNATWDVFRRETDQKIADQKSTIEKLELARSALHQKLTEVSATLTETQEKMDAQAQNFNASNLLYEKQIASLKENEENALRVLAGIKADMKRQAEVAQEAQENYEREVMAHSSALNSLNTFKQLNEQLKSEKENAVVEKLKLLKEMEVLQSSQKAMQSRLEAEISELQTRVEDINKQNELLHAQFEQLAVSKTQYAADGEDSGEGEESKLVSDLREVIRFLRREKEIVETKLQLASQESERAKIQIDHLQSSLDESRISLEEERKKNMDVSITEKHHRELVEKIEQANLLRESNITLRTQLESYSSKLKALEDKLRAKEDEIEPLKVKLTEIEGELEVRKAECKSLTEDNTRWKGRAQQILEKYERIDPAEHEKLKKDVEQLNIAKEEHAKELLYQKQTYENEIKSLKDQIVTLETKIVTLKAESDLALQNKENELNLLRDPETNPLIVELNQKLEAAAKKNKDLAGQANEKLKVAYAARNELKKQVAQLLQEKEQVENKLSELDTVENVSIQPGKEVEETIPMAVSTEPPALQTLSTPTEVDTPSKRERETEAAPVSSPVAKRVRVETDTPIVEEIKETPEPSAAVVVPDAPLKIVPVVERPVSPPKAIVSEISAPPPEAAIPETTTTTAKVPILRHPVVPQPPAVTETAKPPTLMAVDAAPLKSPTKDKSPTTTAGPSTTPTNVSVTQPVTELPKSTDSPAPGTEAAKLQRQMLLKAKLAAESAKKTEGASPVKPAQTSQAQTEKLEGAKVARPFGRGRGAQITVRGRGGKGRGTGDSQKKQ